MTEQTGATASREPTLQWWKDQIKTAQAYMRPRHKMWRDLLRRYHLDFPSDTVHRDQVIRKSSMYPIARQVRASVAFEYPTYTVTTDDDDFVRSGQLLTSAANKATRLMQVKREVQQQTFDALFCAVGWGKYHYNPPGVNAEPPYVSNDEFHEDFVAYTRINPFNLFIDPLTPPHRLGDARFILERLFVPLEFLRDDDRFEKRALGQVKIVDERHGDDDILQDLERAGSLDEAEDERTLAQALHDGKMVELWEVHDRLHGKRLTLSLDATRFLENTLHPFLKVQPVVEQDAFGNQFQTGFEPTGGYLVKGGFAYSPLKIDTSLDGFYPLPSMEYIKDLETMQVEGLTRRHDLTKRYPRVVLANKAELDNNPDLARRVKDARDGEVLGVHDVSAFQEVPWGNPPQDQLNLQAEARQAEEEVLRVSEMAGVHARTATEASFAASAGALNREWFKNRVAELYVDIGTNVLRIMGDARYMPDQFVVRVVATEGGPQEVQQVLEAAHFLTNFQVTVDAESIQPMAAQRHRDNITALVDRLLPHTDIVDKRHLLELMARQYGITNTEALFVTHGDVVSQKLVQLENQQLSQGLDPGVLPDEDHAAHINSHQEALQQALSQLALPQAAPQQNLLRQAFEAHIGAHQQQLGQAAAVLAGGSSAAPEQAGGNSSNNVLSQVRANAQNLHNAAQNQITGMSA